MDDVRDQILEGINIVPKIGIPGRIVVFGPSAEAVLTGSNPEDVLIAAAQVQHGRVLAMAHDGYIKHFASDFTGDEAVGKLHRNIKRWVTNGRFEGNNDVIVRASTKPNQEKLGSCKIIVWDGGDAGIPEDVVRNFISKGGGFVHAVTPWGWLQNRPGKEIQQIPYWNVLKESGFCYTDDYISISETGCSVVENKASGSHIMRAIVETSEDLGKVVVNSGLIMDIQYLPREEMVSMLCSIEQLLKACGNEAETCFQTSGCQKDCKRDQGILEAWQACVAVLPANGMKAPRICEFPGDFTEAPPQLVCTELCFQSDKTEVHSTGFYAPAGVDVTVEVLSGNSKSNWRVQIGAHTDTLKNVHFKRWPRLIQTVKLNGKPSQQNICSPFGGLVYFISPSDLKSDIRVKLSNVVPTPSFSWKNTKDSWELARSSPGLWSDICGELITITLPSTSVREVEDPSEVMSIWDRVVRLYHDLRGTDVSMHRRQWIVADLQPSVGYMHSGYPIVTQMDVGDPGNTGFLLNAVNLKNDGSWGIFHEIGHNMQQPEWTFDGATEVTCNIFTLHAMDVICGKAPWIHPWLADNTKKAIDYLNNGSVFEQWKKSPGIALFVYAQLAREFGWEAYKKVFRRYQTMFSSEKPKNDQEKIDKWFQIFSEISGKNLLPLAMFWGIPISSVAVDGINSWKTPTFFPDDELTTAAVSRTDLVRKYFACA